MYHLTFYKIIHFQQLLKFWVLRDWLEQQKRQDFQARVPTSRLIFIVGLPSSIIISILVNTVSFFLVSFLDLFKLLMFRKHRHYMLFLTIRKMCLISLVKIVSFNDFYFGIYNTTIVFMILFVGNNFLFVFCI